MGTAVHLTGDARTRAVQVIRERHYTHLVPSGKTHYFGYDDAIVAWSIPANKNLARFLLPFDAKVWELSRLWAPDGHDKNLLTQAISATLGGLRRLESVDLVVSYADPNAGHSGGVYRAASWMYHGQSTESRVYVAKNGQTVARRAFHSGQRSLNKAEIIGLGYMETKLPGKHRFVRPLSRRAKRVLSIRQGDRHG
jgi:hypothetical protein